MKIEITAEKLQKKKLFLGVPMYGGLCNEKFARSLMMLTHMTAKYGIELKSHFICNESLITRARNYVVDAFMRSDCTHMIFVDADIGFNAQDVIALLALQNSPEEDEYDIIGAVYPKKTIAWEKVKKAVDKGFGDEDPKNLENFVSDFVFNPIKTEDGKVSFSLKEPVEVSEIGTGFMMIRRETLEKYQEKYPENWYLPDHIRSEHFDGSREIMCYFDTVIDPDSRRYLSEDYYFCQQVRKAGMKVWMCPWMTLSHTGSYTYSGSLLHMAQIQSSPTTDRKNLKKSSKHGKMEFNSRGKMKKR